MDHQGFDDLTRAIARGTSRRQTIKTLAGGAVGGLAALLGGGVQAKNDKADKTNKTACCPGSHPTLCGLTCTDTQTDRTNCGGCGTACASHQTCVRGACQGTAPTPACTDGIKNGSETDIDCGGTCPPCATGKTCVANTDCASGVCCGGVCCAGGQGCDAGQCADQASCQNDPRVGQSCTTGQLGVCAAGTLRCTDGRLTCERNVAPSPEICNGLDDDCDGQTDEGFNLQTDVNNCGFCGRVCQIPNATAACANGACVMASCHEGFADCDGQAANGCETRLDGSFLTDPNNCGRCGNNCAAPNTTMACADGACAIVACDPGFANCNGEVGGGCETATADDPRNCGACNNVCVTESPTTCGMTGQCAGGQCALYPSTTLCATATCTSTTTLQVASFCDGNGACPPAPTIQCPSGTTCNDGACRPE